MILTEYNEELHARTLVEEGRREEREKNAQILQMEREKNAQALQAEKEKNAQALQAEKEKNAQALQAEKEKNARSIRQLLLQVLESKGRISAETTERINCENDPDILRDWASFAIGSSSVEEAERYISR